MIWILRDRLLVSVLTSSSHHTQLLMARRIMNYLLTHLRTKYKHVSAGTISIHNGILTVSTQVYTDFWADSRLRKAWVLAVRHLTTPHSISQLRQLSGQLWQPDDLDIGPCRQGAGWAKLKSKLEMKLDMTWLHRLFMIVYDSWNFDCTWDMQFRSSIETSELYEVYV